MKYRAEIDGLRALAVLPIILFHAQFEIFKGGFIGVDVFFVISGYLISSIILSNIEKGTFSLLDFYERRARRILPALTFVLLITCSISYFLMLPDELENTGQSIIATLLFVNNILLQITSGYWGLSPPFKPLLHTWSLGVEEQFYIIFPILIIVIYKFSPRMLVILPTILLLSSFFIGIYLANHFPVSSFLGIHTRAYELLVGFLCAIYLRAPRNKISLNKKQFLSLVGIAMIVISIFTFDETTPYPGIYSLLPVIGSALIVLFATKGTVLYSFFRLRILVAIGLISYSLYLWHQSLFAYARLASNAEPSLPEYFLMIILSFVFAYLSYRYVEAPYRNVSRVGRKTLIVHLTVTSSLIFLIASTFVLTKGFSSSFYGDSNYGESSVWQNYVHSRSSIANKKSEFLENNKTRLLILGNSHSEDFINILAEADLLRNSELIWRYKKKNYDCDIENEKHEFMPLIKTANIVIFARGSFEGQCFLSAIRYLEHNNIDVFYTDYIHLGYNLNYIKLDRFFSPNHLRSSTRTDFELQEHYKRQALIPAKNYLPLMDLILDDSGAVKILDDDGNLLSVDRTHLTEPGARFIGSLFSQQDNRLTKLLSSPGRDSAITDWK